MRIYCDDIEVFSASEPELRRELERLLFRVRLGQHDLILDDLEGFFASSFFAQAIAIASQLEVRELLERQDPALGDRGVDPATRAPGPRAELVSIAVKERTCRRDGEYPVWEIDASTAGSWSEAPLRLLLENDGDWHLVEAAARVYSRPKVISAMEKKFLHKDQRGGKDEVMNAVKSCRREERVFVFMDSDRKTVDGPEDNTQRKVRRLARRRPNVLPFIMAKREIENYIPDSVWRHSTEGANEAKVKKHRAWRRLSDSEKDFVDMETYFPDAMKHVPKLCDARLVPDAATLESRAGGTELVVLLDQMEAWL
jgi:hypothetical protein